MNTNLLAARAKVKTCPRRAAIQDIYDTLYAFATGHDTLSAQIARDVILATYNSATFKFDFHTMHRLSIAHIQRAMDILSNHLETREDASEYLDEEQIDLLKVPRGYPAHSDFLQDGYRAERDLSIR